MHPKVQLLIRFLAGLAILALGLVITRKLIGAKEDAPVQPQKSAPRPAKVMEVQPGVVIPRTPLEGRVEAKQRMDVIAEVNGVLRVGGKEFREGVKFRAGEVLLRLDDSEWRASIEAERGKFLQALGGALADIQTDFPDRRQKWESYIASIDLSQPLPSLPDPSSQRERLFLANRGITASYHAIRAAEVRGEKFKLLAPFSGVVGVANVDPGALVRAGTPLGTFVGEGEFEIKSAIHARYLPTLAVGDPVEFYEENGELVAQGKVVRLASQVDAATQSASVYCQVEPVSGKGVVLRDGRYLSGYAKSKAISDVVEVPLDLLLPGDEVYAIEEGKLVKTIVQVKFRGTTTALVGGLAPKTVLLAEPISGAFEGMEILQ